MFEKLMSGNTPIIAFTLAGIGILIDIIFIVVERKKHMLSAVILKGTASAFFVSISFYFLSIVGLNVYSIFICIGAICGMWGDIFLNTKYVVKKQHENTIFKIGIAGFMIGHFCYAMAISRFYQDSFPLPLVIAIPIAGIIYGISFVGSKDLLSYSKDLTLIGNSYMFVVMYMFSVALVNMIYCIINFSTATNCSIVFAIGALMFMCSDIMLCFQLFCTKINFKPVRPLILILYYVAQLFIISTIMFLPL